MKFCDQCQTIMFASTSTVGVVYNCPRCANQAEGTPEDTLLAEGYQESTELKYQKHAAFIESSAHDPAGHKVEKQCPKCKMPYMTLVQIGEQMTTIYTCTCGYRS